MQTEHSKATHKVESTVSETTRQETEDQAQHKWHWVEAAVWTERMLTARVHWAYQRSKIVSLFFNELQLLKFSKNRAFSFSEATNQWLMNREN